MRGHRDLRLLFALTVVCAIGSLITPLGAARVIFAVPLTLIFPGYAIVAAAFASRPLAWPERIPLTLGISLACLALSSLVLNYTPGGIRGLPWVLLLVLIVFFCCRGAAKRRGRGSRRRGRTPDQEADPLPRPGRPRPVTALLAVAALAMVAAALILAQATFDNNKAAGYTQLWVTPPKPTDTSAQIGVTSEQQTTRGYRLVVEVEGEDSPLVQTFELAPSETHLTKVNAATESPVGIEAKLYLRSKPDRVYRRVSTQLNPAGASVR
ncbi:MAG: DUF1616 domain-containing protein [Solirubrobacterales bacterium]